MAANCKIYTPEGYVKELLDFAGYKSGLFGKRVLENSCGTGNILVEIVQRYIKDSLERGYSVEKIKQGLSKDITGMETDPAACRKCRKRLEHVASRLGVKGVSWNIIESDALRYSKYKYDYILGNPPYITYHDLDQKTREYAKKHFETCKKGRFDYCYAFIEKGIKSLKSNGVLAYILPNSILKNVWAENLRNYIQPYVQQIIDLRNQGVFKDVTLSPIILVAQKKEYGMNPFVTCSCANEAINYSVERGSLLNHSWTFGGNIQRSATAERRFGDYFRVSSSVATLLNEAFLIEDYEEVDQQFIRVKEHLVERSATRPAVSTKSQQYHKHPMIIFPYAYDKDDHLLRYTEEKFAGEFPHALQYLNLFRQKLNDRSTDKNAKWFEYGRSQALRHLNREKIVMSTIVSRNFQIYLAPTEAVPYAGLYIVAKGDMPLAQAQNILEHDDFKRYAEQHGVVTAKDSYRISSKIVEAYFF